MSCTGIRNLLSPYLDSALSDSLRKRVEAHLERCEACRRELEELRRTVALLGGLDDLEPPEGFAERVAGTAFRSCPVPPARRRAWSGFRIRPAFAAAAALLIVVAAAYVMGGGGAQPLADGRLRMSFGMKAGAPSVQSVADEAQVAEPAVEAPTSEAVENELAEAELSGERGDWRRSPALGEAPEIGFERKVIRTADLRVEVQDFDEAYQAALFTVESCGGYVERSSVFTDEGRPGTESRRIASLVLRIPESAFQTALRDLRSLGEVRGETVEGQDVSAQYYDTQARARTLELKEQRLLEILGEAETVDEILRVENEIWRVREEIERLRSTLKRLDNLVSMSAVNLRLEEPAGEAPGGPGLLDEMLGAFVRSAQRLVRGFERLAVFLAGAAPTLMVLGALFGGGYLLWRSRR